MTNDERFEKLKELFPGMTRTEYQEMVGREVDTADFERILRKIVTDIMHNLPSFEDVPEHACWQRFVFGLRDGKQGAEKILAMAACSLLNINRFDDM